MSNTAPSLADLTAAALASLRDLIIYADTDTRLRAVELFLRHASDIGSWDPALFKTKPAAARRLAEEMKAVLDKLDPAQIATVSAALGGSSPAK